MAAADSDLGPIVSAGSTTVVLTLIGALCKCSGLAEGMARSSIPSSWGR
jgi:hypothetical protein